MERRSKLTREAKRLAAAFKKAAEQHPGDEAGFLDKAEDELERSARKLGSPPLDKRREVTLVTGRADAVFNRLVVEWEAPGRMSGALKHKGNRHAIEQVRRYVDGLVEKERRAPERLAGVACDGRFMVFARYRAGRWIVDPPVPVDERSAEQLLTSVLSAQTGRALTAENLLKDFSKNLLSKQLSDALLDQLEAELGHDPDGITARLLRAVGANVRGRHRGHRGSRGAEGRRPQSSCRRFRAQAAGGRSRQGPVRSSNLLRGRHQADRHPRALSIRGAGEMESR